MHGKKGLEKFTTRNEVAIKSNVYIRKIMGHKSLLANVTGKGLKLLWRPCFDSLIVKLV